MNCLFKVRRKSTGEIVPVYAVNLNCTPSFLIYSRKLNYTDGAWIYVPADRFEPIEKGGEQE